MPADKPEGVVELLMYMLAALGVGGGGGAILRDRLRPASQCGATPCTAGDVKVELQRHHESQSRQMSELQKIAQAAEVRDATTSEQMRSMAAAVTETSRSVAALVSAMERDRTRRGRSDP